MLSSIVLYSIVLFSILDKYIGFWVLVGFLGEVASLGDGIGFVGLGEGIGLNSW